LGSGDFVNDTLADSERLLEKKYRPKKSIDDLIKSVAEERGLSPEMICSGSRKPKISNARSIVAHMAIEEIGHSATDVARHLGIRQTSVLQSVKKRKLCAVGLRYKSKLVKLATSPITRKKWEKARKLFENDPSHPSLNTELLEPKHRLIYSFSFGQKNTEPFLSICLMIKWK